MKKSFRKRKYSNRKYSKKRYRTNKKRNNIKKRRYTKRKNKKKTLRLTGGSGRQGEQGEFDQFKIQAETEAGLLSMDEIMYNEMIDYKKGNSDKTYDDYNKEHLGEDDRDTSHFQRIWDSITDKSEKKHKFTDESNNIDIEKLQQFVNERRAELNDYKKMNLFLRTDTIIKGEQLNTTKDIVEGALKGDGSIEGTDDFRDELTERVDKFLAWRARNGGEKYSALSNSFLDYSTSTHPSAVQSLHSRKATPRGEKRPIINVSAPDPASRSRDEPAPINMKYLFTMHAQSCNQLSKGISGPLQKMMDPQITMEGMRTTYESSQTTRSAMDTAGEETSYLYDSGIVYVSCLVRTWMTALLLYNGHRTQSREKFTLRVIPFIKEKKKYGIKRGNMPTELMYTISSFLHFLNKLNDIGDMEGMEAMEGCMANMPNVIDLEIYVQEPEMDTFTARSIKLNKMRPRGGRFAGYNYSLDCPEISLLESLENHFNAEDSIFRLDGDLNLCMDSGILRGVNMIHVVTHSSLIHDFLRQFSGSGFRKILRHQLMRAEPEPEPDSEPVYTQRLDQPEILSESYLQAIRKQNIYTVELGQSRIPEMKYRGVSNQYFLETQGSEFPEQKKVGGVYLNTIYEGYVSEGGTLAQNKEADICIEIPEEEISTC